MNITIPSLSQSVKNLTDWVRLLARTAVLFLMAFTLLAIVMQSVPLFPVYWTAPKDTHMLLLALSAAFYALK